MSNSGMEVSLGTKCRGVKSCVIAFLFATMNAASMRAGMAYVQNADGVKFASRKQENGQYRIWRIA